MRPNAARQTRTARWLAAAFAFAGAVCAGHAALAGEFPVAVKTATDGTISGRLIEFSLDSGLLLEPDDPDGPRRVAAEDVVEILSEHRSTLADASLVHLELTRGDRLNGRLAGSDDDILHLETATLGTVPVPLEHIRTLRTPAAACPGARATLASLLEHHGDQDALLLINGDVLRGLVTAIDRHGFLVETETGESHVGHASIAAAVMIPIDPPRPGGPQVRLHTTDGQQLTATRFQWAGFSASATVFDGTELHVSGDRIARLEILGGRWQWLTALEPISYQHTPALSVSWDWARDRNVTGGPLRVAGRQFDHGLGVHSECSLTFDLRKDYREFVTSLGLDDRTGPYASVDVEIRVDGQLAYQQARVTPGRLHGPIRLDVTGAQRIKLTVLFGANADLQDRFDWVEPALIRQPNPSRRNN